jgi:hypothetical protein
MKPMFAALAVLTLVFGTVALAAPASAAAAYPYPANQYEGNNN